MSRGIGRGKLRCRKYQVLVKLAYAGGQTAGEICVVNAVTPTVAAEVVEWIWMRRRSSAGIWGKTNWVPKNIVEAKVLVVVDS